MTWEQIIKFEFKPKDNKKTPKKKDKGFKGFKGKRGGKDTMKDFDVSNIVKDILWKKNAESVTLKVKKDLDDCHVYIEIKEINK